MASPLEDLDELTLRCRDEKARQYIAEAVASYRAGAFRSAIVATWVAVCFDVIEKFRELALAGDKEAERQAHDIDATRRTGDLTRALKFERELLELAKDKFELISPLEYIDLDRLQAPDSWQYLEADVRQRLQNYVSNFPAANLNEVDFLVKYAPLEVQARHRVRIATKKELRDTLFFDLPAEVADKYIDLYMESRSFDDANDWAKHMATHTGDFTADHVRRLLTSLAKNDQILGSFQLGPLISNLRSRKKLSEDEFESLLQRNGLEEHSLAARRQA